ncbi:MAG: trypsin-like serine protease, partial [Tannerella sp.]|nr:trypsin-like serine protease [Tannerella sp.]
MRFFRHLDTGMRNVLSACAVGAFLLHVPGAFAQISEGGLPPSFKYAQTLRSALKKTEAPVDFYAEDLREVDNWRAREGAPMPVAKLIEVDYTPENSGSRTALPGGERIWQLHLSVPGATAVMLYYRDFYIPDGGKLFIYSADKARVLGAYTRNTHPDGGLFATEFIGGDELILEYVEPETGSPEKPRIHISEIGYGYNTAALKTFFGITTRSGSCMVNINCEEGEAWQNEKNGVCHTVQKIGKMSYICSGALMNNTAEDFAPLILTARHCAYQEDKLKGKMEVAADASDMKQWLFYFHLEREDCSNGSFAAPAKTMTGCKLLVNTGMEGGSDGMLLQLNAMIPEEYNVFYNGWDRRDTPASSGANLHHPGGDYMKISTYGTPAKQYTFRSSDFTGRTNAHWDVTFQQTANGHSVTEGGSSGSPLYNENKLVVGTLTGGNSTCIFPTGLNIYGKMSYHWDKFNADSAHMDVWLDPAGSGVQTLAGRFRRVFKPVPLNVRAVNLGRSISLSWDAPSGAERPASYNVYRNNQRIGNATSTTFTDGGPTVGSLVYSISAVYEDGEESPFASTTVSFVEF